MKRSILFAAVSVALLGLSGCAVPVEMKEDQAFEREALKAYHKAERQEYRAKEASKVATGAKVAAEARRLMVAHEKQKALADLQKSINK